MTLDNTKVIIIIVVTSIVGVVVAATILVIYFILRGKSEKDIHRDTEKIKIIKVSNETQKNLHPLTTLTRSNEGTVSFSPNDVESLSTLTQTVALGPTNRSTHIVALDQWIVNSSKSQSGGNNQRDHKITQNDDTIKISVQNKYENTDISHSYLSAGTLSMHEEKQKRKL